MDYSEWKKYSAIVWKSVKRLRNLWYCRVKSNGDTFMRATILIEPCYINLTDAFTQSNNINDKFRIFRNFGIFICQRSNFGTKLANIPNRMTWDFFHIVIRLNHCVGMYQLNICNMIIVYALKTLKFFFIGSHLHICSVDTCDEDSSVQYELVLKKCSIVII